MTLGFVASMLVGCGPSTISSDSTEESDACLVGANGCACTMGGTCDGDLVCVDGLCEEPDCAVGSQGCPCTGGGACDAGLICEDDTCVPVSGDGDGDGDGGGDGDGDGDGGGDGDGDGDGDGAGDGDGDGDGEVTYTGVFLNGVDASDQCDAFNQFRGELAAHTYSRITMRGSEDPLGRSCEGPEADTICQNIFIGTNSTVFCDGHSWSVTGNCSGVMEVDASGMICDCDNDFSVRPCAVTNQWGGLQSNNCNTPSQTIEIICEY